MIRHRDRHAESSAAEQQLRDVFWVSGLTTLSFDHAHQDRAPLCRLRCGRDIRAPDVLVLGIDGNHGVEVKTKSPLKVGGYPLDLNDLAASAAVHRGLMPVSIALSPRGLIRRSPGDWHQRDAVELVTAAEAGQIDRMSGSGGQFLRVELEQHLRPLLELVERLGGNAAAVLRRAAREAA